MDLRKLVDETALKNGEIDFIGVAPIERLEGAPSGSKPTEILPQARSVISLGIALNSGLRKANRSAYAGNPQAIYAYSIYGLYVPGDILEQHAYRIVRLLESKGYPSVATPHAFPSNRSRLMGVVSHRHAAVAAGLGDFGLNGLLMTPQAGCLVRLVTVVTEAELRPNPLYSGKPLCLGKSCLKCVKSCPVDAFNQEKEVSLKIGDREFSYLEMKKWRCSFGTYGKRKVALGRKDIDMPEDPRPEDYLRAVVEEDPFQKLEGMVSRCGRCIIECPVGSR